MANVRVNFNSKIPLIYQAEPKKASLLTTLAIASITVLVIGILGYCNVIRGLNANAQLSLCVLGTCASILSSYLLHKAARNHLVYLHQLLRSPDSSLEEIRRVANLLQHNIQYRVNGELALDIAILHHPNAIMHLQYALVDDNHIHNALALADEENSIVILHGLFHIPSGRHRILNLQPYEGGEKPRATPYLYAKCAVVQAIDSQNIPHLRRLINTIPENELLKSNAGTRWRDPTVLHTIMSLSATWQKFKSLEYLLQALEGVDHADGFVRDLLTICSQLKKISLLIEFLKATTTLNYTALQKGRAALFIIVSDPTQISEALDFIIGLNLSPAQLRDLFSAHSIPKKLVVKHLIDSVNLELLEKLIPALSIRDLVEIGLHLPIRNPASKEKCYELIDGNESFRALAEANSLNLDFVSVIAHYPNENFGPLLSALFPKGPTTFGYCYFRISVVSANLSATQWFGHNQNLRISIPTINRLRGTIFSLMQTPAKKVSEIVEDPNSYEESLMCLEADKNWRFFSDLPINARDLSKRVAALSNLYQFTNIKEHRTKFNAVLMQETQLLSPLVEIISKYFVWIDLSSPSAIID